MRKPKTFLYQLLRTRYGWLGVVRTILGIYAIILPKSSKEEVLGELNQKFRRGLKKGKRGFKKISESLKKYFAGKRVKFTNALDLSGSTKFERKVWRMACKIPRGENRSYSWVARCIKLPRATQAVGQALSRNKLPIIIPCHRVMEKGGYLGGFSPGVAFKRLLLKIEGRLW